MASLHKDPRNKSPYWYCAYTLPDGRRAFRSTKQRDRKKALDVARTLEKAAEKARAGELTEAQVRKLLEGILESVGQSPIRSETVRSFFNTCSPAKSFPPHRQRMRFIVSALQNFWVRSLSRLTDRSPALPRPMWRCSGIAVQKKITSLAARSAWILELSEAYFRVPDAKG